MQLAGTFTIVLLLFSASSFGLGIETCNRPHDFSQTNAVKNYENCLSQQYSYCQQHSDSATCKKFLATWRKTESPMSVRQEDLPKRCSILHDGSYRCVQKPLRLLPPEPEPIFTPPTTTDEGEGSAPPASPTPGTGGASVPLPPPPAAPALLPPIHGPSGK